MLRHPFAAFAALLSLVLVTAPATPAAAWGADAHSAVAEIAERRLTPTAQARLGYLLGGGASLASWSGWADAIALVRPETRRWHYVNIPLDAAGYDAERDCAPQPSNDAPIAGCVVTALRANIAVLQSPSAGPDARRTALYYVVHLVADIHQPLHAADRGDAGGSRLPVRLGELETSLHLLWDVFLFESVSFDWGVIQRQVDDRLRREPPEPALTIAPIETWLAESHGIAASVAYDIPAPGADGVVTLDEALAARALEAALDRVGLAGLRLAAILNCALGKDAPSEPCGG